MQSVPLVQTPDRLINQVQQNIIQSLRPVLSNPLVNGIILTNQSLVSGTNTITHGLGRAIQGWIVVGLNAAASIYDQQSSNSSPQSSLILISDAAVTVNLYVF